MNGKPKRKLKVIMSIASVVCVLWGMPNISRAEEDPMGFTVETIMPTSQIDQNKTYFYIQTTQNEEQTLKVRVKGTSEEPVKIKTYVANAMTSESGTVNYVAKYEKDTTLQQSIEEITTVSEDTFELKLGEEKVVEIKVTPPAESYDGVKMGAIYFERVLEEKKEGKINTEYSYRIGLMTSESDTIYTDSQELKLLDVKPELKRTQKSITLQLQNPEPKTIADFYMDTKIINEKTGKVVKTQKLSGGMMAPNSHFDYSVNWGIDAIPSGKYIAKVSAKSRYKEWELEKKFEITKEQAKKMNEETLYKLTLPNWAYIGTVILGVMTISLTLLLTIRSKKWKEEERKLRKKKGKRKKKPRKGDA